MKATHILTVACLFSACASTSLRVAEAELAPLSAEQRAAYGPAEEALTAAQAERGDIRKRHEEALRQVKISEELINKAEADLRVAQLSFDSAQETRNADAMLPAKEQREKAEQALAHARAEHAVREAEEDLAQAQLDQADAQVDVAEADLELARLEAVLAAKEKVTPEDEERRANFKSQAADAELSLAHKKQDTADAQTALTQAQSALAALSPSPVGEPAAAPTATETDSPPEQADAKAPAPTADAAAAKE